MMDSKDNIIIALERIEQRLGSLERWLRFGNIDKLRSILEIEMKDDNKKLAYEYSDGSRGYREVGQLANVPAPTVQAWWTRWFTLGIMEPSSTRTGRVQRICSLREIGLDIPAEIQKKSKQKTYSNKS
jgi:hypothetical protein